MTVIYVPERERPSSRAEPFCKGGFRHHSKLWPSRQFTRGVLFFASLALTCFPACHRDQRIVVGCKNFTEQIILGELIAQQIENKIHVPVERRFYLGGTYIAHQSILAGRIDIYPEYTGTALTAILKEKPAASAGSNVKAVYDRVKSEYENRFHLTLAPAFGFNDTFAIEIRGAEARRLHLQTISQATIYTPKWR